MPGIDTHVTAIEASYNEAANQGADAATTKAHNDLLVSQRGLAALELNRINARPALRDLITAMDTRLTALQAAATAEGNADKRVAMDRALAALRDLRQQIIDREVAVAGVSGQVGDAFRSTVNRVDTFAQENITNTTGGRAAVAVVGGIGLFAAGRWLWDKIRGYSRRGVPSGLPPATSATPARTTP